MYWTFDCLYPTWNCLVTIRYFSLSTHDCLLVCNYGQILLALTILIPKERSRCWNAIGAQNCPSIYQSRPNTVLWCQRKQTDRFIYHYICIQTTFGKRKCFKIHAQNFVKCFISIIYLILRLFKFVYRVYLECRLVD